MLNWIVWNRTDYLHKMDLVLSNLQRLICHKTPTTNHSTPWISPCREKSSGFTMSDKIHGMKRKLEMWRNRVSKDCFDMFHNLSTTVEEADCEFETSIIKDNVTKQLTVLSERFEVYSFGRVLPFCRSAEGVFYSPSWVGKGISAETLWV